ncbi:MAG: Asp-tRNA(Asn)/Glu-tRNA(Gln) amidotransferase subunit GatC [Oscillospiraceae bacterium]|nr:Asp-tRNA(Asn)/Glu-tRNA(Gln) amidotransferase subunit GatC [Oscillospiraceae bacterium]
MQIDDKLISYLEDLSCLTFEDDQKQKLTGELEKILDSMARLGELDTENIPERSHPFDNVNAFRADETEASFDPELILKNAPDRDFETLIAPKTVE